MNEGDTGYGRAGEAGKPRRTAFDWPQDTGTVDAVLREMGVQVGLRRRRRQRVLAASGALAVLIFSAWNWQPQVAEPRAAGADAMPVATTAPARRHLPDGSVVLLRADAVVEVDYTAHARHVRLMRGEAIFDVEKDAARPFIVSAGRVDVRAIGTEFAVGLQDAAVEVLVTEGEVAVHGSELPAAAPAAHAASAPAVVPPTRFAAPAVVSAPAVVAAAEYKLQAGKRIVVPLSPAAPAPDVLAVSPEEISRRLGWRVPTLQFSRTPLRDAVAMINKHSRVRLVLEDPALNDLPLSGAIRADNIEALFELLAADHGIRTQPRGAAEIALIPARRGP